MECGICCKHLSSSRHPICAGCARATTYEPRIEQVTGLIGRERLCEQVRTILPRTPQSYADDSAPTGLDVDLTEASRKLEVDDHRARIERIEQKTKDINQQAALRMQIEQARLDNRRRKVKNNAWRETLRSKAAELRSQKAQAEGAVRIDISRLKQRLVKVNSRTMSGRLQLCRETARLSGLVLRRRKARDGTIFDEYAIGGLTIPDLRNLNNTRPEAVSAALSHISRMLTVCCHYLSVRPPAEIISPQPDFPQPAMLSLQSSYQAYELSSSNMTSSVSRSISSSRLLSGASSRPKLRPLHLDKPLPRLAKEDINTYNLFTEGVTLLAWDIAWLCRTQGVPNIDTWEDVCAVGRNLWQLLMVDQSRNTTVATKQTFTAQFGEYSHGSSFRNLAGPEGVEMVRTWRLQSLARVSDKLKSHLLTEMSGAEWELLDEKEWNQDREDEEAVLVGGTMPVDKMGISYVTAIGGGEEGAQVGEDEDGRGKGVSGWMKLKSRSG